MVRPRKDFDCSESNLLRARTSNAHEKTQDNKAHDDVSLRGDSDCSFLYSGRVKDRGYATEDDRPE